MSDCERCNGFGYVAVFNHDDDQECPACNGSGDDQDAVVAHYAQLYRHPFMLQGYLFADLHELESARDAAWYRAGWYDVLGYDRHGVSYTSVDDEWGDALWSMGSMIERDNERVYSTKEQY